MALLNVLDAPAAEAALTDWFATKLPDASDIRIGELDIPQSAGMSMTTILFKVSWREGGEAKALDLVARVAPTTAGLFPDPDLAREFRLIQALGRHTDVAVPTARWLEGEASVLGSPFMVLDRVYGKVPGDDPPYTVEGWVLDLASRDRAKLYENALQAIVRIQAVDWRALDLGFLDKPEFGPTGRDQQIAYLEDLYGWAAEGRTSPTIDAALAWAKANAPADEELVLNWGDPRIGNVIYGDDLSVQAVLDWEMSAIASPQMELGWFVFFVRYYSEGIGVPIPDGLQTRDELIARYQELTGRNTDNVDYYEAFAALRLSILLMRAGHLMIAAGALPPDNPMPVNNPASQVLARMLDLPAPEGEVVNFVGKR